MCLFACVYRFQNHSCAVKCFLTERYCFKCEKSHYETFMEQFCFWNANCWFGKKEVQNRPINSSFIKVGYYGHHRPSIDQPAYCCHQNQPKPSFPFNLKWFMFVLIKLVFLLKKVHYFFVWFSLLIYYLYAMVLVAILWFGFWKLLQDISSI